MGGSAIRRDLDGLEKVIVTFEMYGPATPGQIEQFNEAFDALIAKRGIQRNSEIWDKTAGDPINPEWPAAPPVQ